MLLLIRTGLSILAAVTLNYRDHVTCVVSLMFSRQELSERLV